MPMQPLDPSLFGGSSASHTKLQPAVDAADTDVLPKGTNVWYLHRSGAWQPARVTQVDVTDPAGAFYQVGSICHCTELSCTMLRLPHHLK